MISDLTTEIHGLANDEKSDPKLKLDEATRDSYVKALNDFRSALQGRLDTINRLEGIGDPGGLQSAKDTKGHLQRQGNAFKYSIMEYMTYLDAFADAVTKSASRLIQSG